MVNRSLAPPTLSSVISIANEFNNDVLGSFENLIAETSASDPDDTRLAKFCKANEVNETEVRHFLSLLAYLFVSTSELSEDEIAPAIDSLVRENSELDDGEVSRLVMQFVKLLQYRDEQDVAQKQERLLRGFLPFMLKSASFVDTRHDFGRNEDGELNGEVTVGGLIAQLRLTTNSPKPNERFVVFQIDEKALKQLQETLDEVSKKFEIIRGQNGLS